MWIECNCVQREHERERERSLPHCNRRVAKEGDKRSLPLCFPISVFSSHSDILQSVGCRGFSHIWVSTLTFCVFSLFISVFLCIIRLLSCGRVQRSESTPITNYFGPIAFRHILFFKHCPCHFRIVRLVLPLSHTVLLWRILAREFPSYSLLLQISGELAGELLIFVTWFFYPPPVQLSSSASWNKRRLRSSSLSRRSMFASRSRQ